MMRWLPAFLAGAAVTAACLLPAPAARADEAPALVEKGRALIQKGDWPGARDAFLAAVAKDAKSVDARRGAAEALLGLGQSEDAVEQANAGLDLVENKDAGLWLLVARGYLQKGEGLSANKDEQGIAFADAKAKASEALKRDPAMNLARVVLAKACRLTDEADRAVSVLKEGLEKTPADFDLLFELGMVRLRKGEYEEALAAFDAAAAADPKSAEAQYRRGAALAFLKRFDDASKAYARAAILDPTNRQYLKNLVTFAKDGTIGQLRAIVKEKPDFAWAHAYLAYYLAYAKDEAGALGSSKAAMALLPKDADLVAWHGQILEILKKPDFMGWYRKALGMNAQCKIAWDKLADIACNPGNATKADDRVEIIEFLGKTRPDDGIFWNNVGLLYRDKLKDFRRSLEAYQKAAALSPTDQGIQNDTGLIFLFHGPSIGVDPKGGLPYFERCLALVRGEEQQSPEMGYRDTLENLAKYYSEVEKDPAKCLEYAKERNDPDMWAKLPKGLGVFSPRAAQAIQWAEKEMKH